jgi:kynureninase
MVIDPQGGLFRERFPILADKSYLASHSLGAVMEATGEALQRYYLDWARLGIEAWDGPFWQSVTEFQKLLGGLLGWPADSVCPLQNATRAMAALASSFDYRGERRRILLSELEFTTSFPFWKAQEEIGAEVHIVPSPDGRSIPLDSFEAELDERTLLVVCSHAYFRSGNLCPDLQAFSSAVHRVGGRLLLDVYQTLGALPVDAAACGVDAVVGGCHKWLCGGPGAGFLALAPDYWPSLRPRLTGWFGLNDPFAYEKSLSRGLPHESALRFLAGTPNIPALYACRPALRLISEIGPEAIRLVSTSLTEHLRERLQERGFDVLSPADPAHRNGMLCVAPPRGRSGPEVVAALGVQGIMVDYRPDCGLRVSPHFYNTVDDLDRFVEALSEHG